MATPIDPDLQQADIARIRAALPHRYPMLMIDRVANIIPGKSAMGLKNVSANEPFFQGHFPTRPIMPGVLIIEAMAQTAALHVLTAGDGFPPGTLVYFMSVEAAKFRAPVVPGDLLELHVAETRRRSKVWRYQGVAKVDDRVVAEADFTAMIVPPEAGDTV